MHDHEPSPRTAAGVSVAVAGESSQHDFYVRHRAWMLRYAFAIIDDADSAEDIVETVLIKVLNANTSLIRDVERYLRTAVLNACRRELSRSQRIIPLSTSLVDEFDRVARLESSIEVEQLIRTLPPDCATVARARASGLKLSEIAAAFGVSEKTVSAQLQRAKLLIREFIMINDGADSRDLALLRAGRTGPRPRLRPTAPRRPAAQRGKDSAPVEPTILRPAASNTKIVVAAPAAAGRSTPASSGSE